MTYKVETEFDHEGLKCAVIMTEMGHRCGYVGLPKEHPLYGKDYSDKSEHLFLSRLEGEPLGKRGVLSLLSMAISEESEYARIDCYFNVHGGITYSGGGEDCEYPVKSDLWWFGYDCAHCDDAPDLNAIENESTRDTYMRFPRHGTVRSLDYCIDECKCLAEQLSKIGGSEYEIA